jgi:hypothetical protein
MSALAATPHAAVWDYCISGLSVRSEVALPGSSECALSTQIPDVYVRLGKVPSSLQRVTASGPNWQLASTCFLMEVPGAVRFLVTSGTDILVEPARDTSAEDAAVFIVGTGLAITLYQRGTLLLHASVVASGTRSYAFVGASGAGKSTLAALLCARGGCELVSDDVAAIDFEAEHPVVRSDARQFRLWDDMIELFALQAQRRRPVRSMLQKYHLDAGPVRLTAPPLAALYLLEPSTVADELSIEPLALVQAAPALQDNLYRRALAARIGQQCDGFARIARLLGHTRVYRLRRCLDAAVNHRIVTRLQAHWATW